MKIKGKLWSRDELILSLNLYFNLEYVKIKSKTPEIVALALLTGRSPISIKMRLANYITCDPKLNAMGIKGLDGGLAQCQPIWDEFSYNKELLSKESERIFSILKSANLSLDKYDNIVNLIDQEVIWKKILNLLRTTNRLNYFGNNPYFLEIGSATYFVFIKNLTRAYTNRSFDVCRIQLPRSTKFESAKRSKVPFITFGYCEQYDTIAYWSSDKIKSRLNGKGNVSLYSRFSAQIPPDKGKYKVLVLNNGELVTIFNSDDIGLFFTKLRFSNISYPFIEDGLFANENISKNASKDIPNASSIDKVLFTLVAPHLSDASELKAIQICISYFEESNIDYDLLKIKNILVRFKSLKTSELI